MVAVERDVPGTPATASEAHATRGGRWHRVSAISLVVLLVGLALTAGLSWLAYALNDRNETRLLDLETMQAATVLQVVVPTIQAPLAASAQAAAQNRGDPIAFKNYISGQVGKTGPFVSASLWQLSRMSARTVTVVGTPPTLANDRAAIARFLTDALQVKGLAVTRPIAPTTASPRLGYAYVAGSGSTKYAVYAESALPPGRKAPPQPTNAPFAGLGDFALYIGPTAAPEMLLEANVDSDALPLKGRTSTVVVPFGSSSLTLVASSNGTLGGALSGRIWWILAITGSGLSVAAALTAERLVRGRRAAEHLTGEVGRLLGEQRTIAETLQRALLPYAVPEIPGVELGVRYIPGDYGVGIGGDWYDLIPLDDRRFFFVVGDVSGRGVTAASVMASLHFAIRGFVSEGHEPATVLTILAGLLNVSRDHHFATVLCGIADVPRHEIIFASAGHLPPLLIGNGTSDFVTADVGPPIGVGTRATYQPVTVSVPPGGTFLVYTDGLVERRGESLDAGLARLKTSVAGSSGSLEALLDTIEAELSQADQEDDTAILGVTWLN